MIISASRRTDIPAFHSEWLINRLRAGFVLVNPHRSSGRFHRIPLFPDVVDCIVFRTKNPAPMLGRLDALRDYNYMFNITMNPYGRGMETGIPPLKERVGTFRRLADKTGPLGMVWRYDPVMLSPDYDLGFHCRAFTYLCRELQGMAYKCIVGFIIHHPFVAKKIDPYRIEHRSVEDVLRIGELFAGIAGRYGVLLETCAEEVDLDRFGIRHGACVERHHLEKLCGYRFGRVKEKYLRPHCNCMESVDIGHYSTCGNGCLYCYATPTFPDMNTRPDSPSLDPDYSAKNRSIGIVDLKAHSHRNIQAELF
ncbi:MAG: DUF1848 domain-containing protein [Rikenellaceae bacterium]|nr:DUF1848 domain-containing protein [Rikenellaceae bacterium]